MKVSIVVATYNRAGLLDDALYTYSQQDMPYDEWEYLLADDSSTDDTVKVVKKWQKKGMNLRLFDASSDLNSPKEVGKWRDGCKLRNALSTFAYGEVLVSTHPEILIGPSALSLIYATVKAFPHAWATAVPFWMPYGLLPLGWKKDISKINKMEGFYDPSWPDPLNSPGAPDYRNQHQEIRKDWQSEVFWGMDMGLWRKIGGFREFEVWGSVDIDFMERRRAYGIPTIIVQDQGHSLFVYHQAHESARDMDLTMAALAGTSYRTQEQVIRAGGLTSSYHHGHRERAMDATIGGIMDDHLTRYRFASVFADGKHVLDIPCGTGYGAYLMPYTNTYVGVDIDAESISWASKNYGSPIRKFLVGDMTTIPADDENFDMVVCFEGMEHISREERLIFVNEMYRVLVPGGTFIISTPQKGATPGTPYDKYMMYSGELLGYFKSSVDWWKHLDWFYQDSYGWAEVKPGEPPATAEIMILGGTKV